MFFIEHVHMSLLKQTNQCSNQRSAQLLAKTKTKQTKANKLRSGRIRPGQGATSQLSFVLFVLFLLVLASTCALLFVLIETKVNVLAKTTNNTIKQKHMKTGRWLPGQGGPSQISCYVFVLVLART